MNALIGEKLEKLASELLDKAAAHEDIQIKMECFKILSAYWLNTTKLAKRPKSEGADELDDEEKVVPMSQHLRRYDDAKGA